MKALTEHDRTLSCLSRSLQVYLRYRRVTPLAQNTDLLAEFSHGLLLQPVGLFATEHPLTMENSFNFYVYNKRLGK